MAEVNRKVVPEIIIDWGTGTDADTSLYNDVSNKFLLPAGVRISWGRDQARSTAPAKVETLDLTLDNTDGTFSNVSGPLAGFITRGPTVIAYVSIDYEIAVDDLETFADDEYYVDGSLTSLLFDGKIDSASQIMAETKSVTIRALGKLSMFNKQKVTIPLQEGASVDEILELICDAIGFAGTRTFDSGDSIILYWWASDQLPLELMYQLVPATEGSNSAIYMAPNELHFEGRQFRSSNDRSVNVQYYLFDALQSTDPPVGKPIYHNPPTTLNQNVEEVYNKVTAKTNYRTLGNLTQVWSFGATITLGADEVKTIYATMSNPVKDAVVPVDGTDYESSNNLASVTLSATSGTRIAITLTAGPLGATVTGPTLQTADGIYLRAKELSVASTADIVSTVDTDDSIARYDLQEYTLPTWPEINPNNIQDTVNGIARRYKQPRDQITIRVFNVDAYHTTMILDTKISDRIHIKSTHQGLDNDFFVETKTIEILGNGNIVGIFDCERAYDEDAFRFGVSTFGPYDSVTNPLSLPFGE